MTLYLKDKKYKIVICEDLDRNDNPFEGVTLKLYKRRFRLFYKCMNMVEINFRSTYHFDFPMPAIRYVKLGGPNTEGYTDNRSNMVDNMELYLKSLIQNAFELDLTESDLDYSSYKSLVREQRLEKLLK
ncbi:MAG: hypothetical protein SLAVMIC_00180 [uncultured marine phage]|uniref:Uncharacterized protein n=1 Tax=uncultured marine phage TaxID=707152 RepID=A0A8D9FRX4_9VIRU|nr:MAG: hypothetical protein SLAVMIC_00180 [uncultured marine phage]